MDDALRAHEAERLRVRRQLAGTPADAPTVGLAMSGGGIRSATFCLGLLRGLAQRGQLTRIDYLSTVSGGGYMGAMFGRLVTAVGIVRAQELLARHDSPVLAWLRRNGRYLTPSGSRDLGIAVVSYLRAFFAIHGEFMIVCLPFALFVMAPHIWQATTGARFGFAQWQSWQVLWWPAALGLWLLLAPGLMAGYWVARDTADPGRRRVLMPLRDLVFVALLGLALVLVWAAARPPLPGLQAPLTVPALVLVAISSCAIGMVGAQLRLRFSDDTRSLAVARLRNRLTHALRLVALVAAAMLLFGALDRASWWLLESLASGDPWVWGGVGFGGAVVLLMRALAQPLLQLSQRTQPSSLKAWVPRLVNLLGLVGVAMLVCSWLVLAQLLVFHPQPFAGLEAFGPGARAVMLLALCAVWIGLSAGNEQMANASSLHSFYRARLTRAYLAVGNTGRPIARAAAAVPAGLDAEAARQARRQHHDLLDVTAVVEGDDTGLTSYRPEAAGGPIHLINTCLNQTRDDASGLFNADRKGTLVTASWYGFEVGAEQVVPVPVQPVEGAAGKDTGTLGRWIAVSGAAAAPGAGAYTSRGWALLLYFLGVRLGYWLRSPQPASITGLRRWLWRHAIKPVMLWSEGTATYFGATRPWWYLSDGGHFENTAVYALLKRRLDFMILADCGADADYEFGDLENLVRKARIDLGAEIEFYTRQDAARLFTLAGASLTVLSPEDMADNHSSRGVLLARIRYGAHGGLPAAEGTLLVIKPNLHDALDVDLLAYAQRRPGFPHETTGDQSFDEAQWESYHRLGEDFGRELHPAWLSQIPGWTRHERHPPIVAARLRGQGAAPEAVTRDPLWKRSARATVVGASLGLGASGTLLISLWQVQEALLASQKSEREEVRRLFSDSSKAFGEIEGTCPRITEQDSTRLQQLQTVQGAGSLAPIERDGIGRLLKRVAADDCPVRLQACSQDPLRHTWRTLCANLERSAGPRSAGAFDYWAPPRAAGIGVADLVGHALALLQGGPMPPASGARAQAAAAAALVLPAMADANGEDAAAVLADLQLPAIGRIVEHCPRGAEAASLNIRAYDEPMRELARRLRDPLLVPAAQALTVPSAENVTTTALVQGTRRPVPWPQATLLVRRSDRERQPACIDALQSYLTITLTGLRRVPTEVWLRELPDDPLQRSRVFELWLPPTPGWGAPIGA
ncbi:hypothetical protein [Rivibacter subsaxonicus]|uniref:Patatin-like phospholipase n=1 Tax=Rivibacter subsaxonicus TaxID=457575 RepID=A0A4Q7VWA7_9BURK|nr:hypothetical protein [Rivibacter subsaxonicus]RZU01012.1 hypothetical protein EV670_1725 [Rivibacter subsaxonicus]